MSALWHWWKTYIKPYVGFIRFTMKTTLETSYKQCKVILFVWHPMDHHQQTRWGGGVPQDLLPCSSHWGVYTWTWSSRDTSTFEAVVWEPERCWIECWQTKRANIRSLAVNVKLPCDSLLGTAVRTNSNEQQTCLQPSVCFYCSPCLWYWWCFNTNTAIPWNCSTNLQRTRAG